MTEKRYFYTDPLAAAWMSKHFGMEFADGDTFRSAIEVADQDQAVMPFYIHPDSLPLLEPLADDLVRVGYLVHAWTAGYVIPYVARVTEVNGEDFKIQYLAQENAIRYLEENWKRNPVSIIQRNGNPFFWPECDN